MKKAGRKLPLKKQEDSLLMLRKYLGGDPFSEIARSFQITPAAVAKRIRTYLQRVLDYNQVDIWVVRGKALARDSEVYQRYLFDTLEHKADVLLLLGRYLKGEAPQAQPIVEKLDEGLSVKEFLVSLLSGQGIEDAMAEDLIMFCSKQLSLICSPLSLCLQKPIHQIDLRKISQMAFIVGLELAEFKKKK